MKKGWLFLLYAEEKVEPICLARFEYEGKNELNINILWYDFF
ncbi:hypothetical protein bthur0005_3450 [Bacillus thuringiensis serovar pakistani str. T13001]|nr:hypothetical protein bthur0005_3450 [Bacillus thuringiensis serovar pakistani str. T13001]